MKVQRKVQMIGALPVVAAGLLLAMILLAGKSNVKDVIQESKQTASDEVQALAKNSTAAIARDVWRMCEIQMEAIQQKVDYDLNVARDQMNSMGQVKLSNEEIEWKAVNQYTKTPLNVSLPKMMVGNTWLGQNTDMAIESPIVDKVQKMVGGTCTIFQRMNEAGDMLRISTNVKKEDGTRAVGTYIPAVNPDGKPNPVISTVMSGQTFHGRAYVVNDWYITAYEPIRDENDQIIGVLYVGVMQEHVESLRRGIMNITVGKTGYVFVLGGKDDHKGHYIISDEGKRDGEDIYDAKDADGNAFISEVVEKAVDLETENGAHIPVAFHRYPWKNEGDEEARMKITAISYFEPWDWVIGAGAYESDYAPVQEKIDGSFSVILSHFSSVINLSLAMIAVLAVVGVIVATLLSRRIAHPKS